MNVFIVYWHPEPQSFNAAMFRTACQALAEAGHSVIASDLHQMQFDPVSSRSNFTTIKDAQYFKPQLEEMYATEQHGFADEVEAEIRKIEHCDLMIWQFPLWWFGLPAVLKGWVDRVFAMGRTYGGGRVYEKGVFQGKRALLSLTTGGPEAAYLADGFNGDISSILRPIQRGILQFTGFALLSPHIVYGSVKLSQDERAQQLSSYAARLQQIAQESPIAIGRY